MSAYCFSSWLVREKDNFVNQSWQFYVNFNIKLVSFETVFVTPLREKSLYSAVCMHDITWQIYILLFQYKIWLKPSAEQQFLYGHHVMKSGLGRITENTPQYQGVIVYNMADLPLVIDSLYTDTLIGLFYPEHEKQKHQLNCTVCIQQKDLDQPGHLPSLIRDFAVRMKKGWSLSYPLNAQRRLRSDWADAQTDLSLCWAHRPFCWFCHNAAHFININMIQQ